MRLESAHTVTHRVPVNVLREVANRDDREPVPCGRVTSVTVEFGGYSDTIADTAVVEDRAITRGGTACEAGQEAEARLCPAGAHIKRGREEPVTSACAVRDARGWSRSLLLPPCFLLLVLFAWFPRHH